MISGAAIVEFLEKEGLAKRIVGHPAMVDVDGVASYDIAEPNHVTWMKLPGKVTEIECGVLIVQDGVQVEAEAEPWNVTLSADRPRLALLSVIREFFPSHAGHSPVITYPSDDVDIHGTAVIGCRGQGPEVVDGVHEEFPHLGGVVLGARVRIGAFCTICRGVLGDTVIDDDVTIGHQVNIGHGVILRRSSRIAPHCSVGGGSVLGEGAVLWQGVMVADKVKIGERAVVGIGSVVLKDIPAGEVWAGNPARFIRKRTEDDPRGLGPGRC